MKKLIILVVALFALVACPETPEYHNLYVIKNNTEHNVKVVYYYYKTYSDTITVAANSFYEKNDNIFDFYYPDSAKIYFDDTKVLNFYADSAQRNNILWPSNFEMVGQSDKANNTVYYYSITNKDYNEAVAVK
ncbi:MAG: hypothetical protein J6X43_11695 [Bacteroidales bacterium]|nr:hypothetical protein [Bacteroidales bacterium]